MNITYSEANRLFRIETEHTVYAIAITDQEGFLTHAYYGARANAEDDLTYLLRTDELPYTPSLNARDRSSFLDSAPMELPGTGVGDFRESLIDFETEGGHRAFQPLYKAHRIFDGKKKLEGMPATFGPDAQTKTLEIDAQDAVTGVQVTLSYSVFADSDAIARSVRVTNGGKASIRLNKILSMSLDMDGLDNDARSYEMLSLHGSWARERQIDRRTLGYGKTSVSSTRGESSHQENPFIALLSADCNQEHGQAYGFHFAYSGNFLAQVEKNQFGMLRVSMGIHPEGFCFELKPGESFQAPEVLLVYSAEGIGGMSRIYHDLYREHMIRSPYKDKKRPILINNWEATYFDFDTEKLLSIAREAKKSGIEMLVMDDGWFGYRNDDNTSLGDWFVNEDKLQGGLKYLVDEVGKIGLQFGIWFEPEMISPDSDLYREHPDWAIRVPDREPCRMRNQYVLDLSRKEVRDEIWKRVSAVLHSANIAYVKWDMNRQLCDIGSCKLPADRQGELLHRYVLGMYELQERLITEFPDLLLENCSGGGARFDPGMLYYSPQIWCSDDTDAIERLGIQEGTEICYPLSAMGAHVSDCPNHIVGRVTPFETRGNVALAGTFGYELDVTRIPESDRAQIPDQVATYHKYNDLVRTGDYYRIASYRENGLYDAWEVVAKDKSEALVTYVQVMARPNQHSRKLHIPGLAENRNYTVHFENAQMEERRAKNESCAGMKDITVHGDTLANGGLLMPPLFGDYTSIRIHLTAN